MVLPDSARRQSLERAFKKIKHQVLSFDEPAAQLYGEIMSKRKLEGRPMSLLMAKLQQLLFQTI